jgi:hypothetical protein
MASAPNFEQLIAEISALDESSAFLEQEKTREIAYVLDNQHHFASVLDLIPRRRASLRILDLGPSPYHLAHVVWPPLRMGILLECDVL